MVSAAYLGKSLCEGITLEFDIRVRRQMKKAEKAKLERILNNYFKEIHKIYAEGNFRVESFYDFAPKVGNLLHICINQ